MHETVVSRPVLLVVDDELPILRVVGRLAAKVGFEVVTCTSGSEALRGLTRQPADLAMVDLCMPDINGLDLRRQIRSAVPSCEVILMTACAGVDRPEEGVEPGAREYMSKPLDFQRLREVLVEIRDDRERRSQILVLESQAARELDERACMLAKGTMISVRDLETQRSTEPFEPLEALEREHIVDVLQKVSGNRMAAAKVLGISRRALYRRLDRHHIVDTAAQRTIRRRA